MHTQPPPPHTHTHTHTHISSSPDTQNTHLTLKRCRLTAKTHSTDRSNLIYNACVPCVCVGVRACHSVRQRRAEGVRGQNCKFESVTYHVIYLSSTTTPLLHTHTHTHTQSIHPCPTQPFIPIFRIINQHVPSYFASFLLFLSICGLHHCHPLVVKQRSPTGNLFPQPGRLQ